MATEQQLALVDALERHKLLVCVGPLVPMAAGLPGLRDLIERCRLRLVELGHHEPDLSGSFADALEHAERLIGSAPFTSLVRAAWEPVVPVPVPASAQALVGLSTGLNALVTTNLDRLLERAFEGRWHTIEEFTPDLAKRTRVIFKVRGTVGQSTTWRLTARQQANDHLADAPRRHALAALLRNHVVLFVGFAPDDEALSELLDVRGHPVADERRRATETSHPDVALVPAATLRERAALGARGVEVVPLAGEYDAAAAAYLQTLADELGRRTHRPVPTVAAEVDAAEPDEENPYPGLQPFTARNRRYFFGREEDLSRVVAQLGQTGRTSHSWLLVDGPSGVGKSSLLQAGLLPALEQGELQILAVPRAWRTVTLRPGPAPVVELANQFHRALIGDGLCDLTASALGAAVQHRAAALVEFVAACLPASDGLVLLVDQLEEALLVPDAGAREGFAAALAELLMRSPRPLLLITALRSDFLGDLPRLPALYERITSTSPPARYTLATLRSAQLAAAIEHPARKARAELEPGLAARVLADAGNIERGGGEDATPETALPLVAAVMTSLYDQRAGRHLTHAQYEALGGVAGALTGRADEALVPLRSRVAEAELWTFFRQFVAADSQGRMTRRSVPRTDALTPLGGGLAAENLLAHLTGSARSMRLIIVRAEGDGRRVDLAHDALLRNWKWLRDHIDRDRVEVLRESELAQAAARWDRLGRPRDGLPSGAEAKYFLRASTVAGSLPRAYQDALRAHMRRRRRAGLAVIAVLASGVLTLAGVSVYAWKQRGETLAKTQLAEEWLDAANSISLEERGSMEESAGNLAAARGHFERSVKARELLAAADPTGAQAQRALSIALERLGNLEVQAGNLVAARGYFERSVKAREVLATTDPTSNRVQSDLSESLERLGDVEVQAGNLIAARGLFERSVKAREMQAADLTGIQDQFEFQWALGGLSISLLKLGEVEVQAGNLVAARGHFDRSLKIAEAVAAADPILGQSAAQRDLSVALERLGNLEVQVGNLAAARGHFDRSLKISDALAAADPTSTEAQRDLFISLDKLGDVEVQAGNLAAARGHFDRLLKIAEALAAADPTSTQPQRDLSVALERLGNLEVQAGNLAAARGHVDRSLKIGEALAVADPTSTQAQRDLSVSLIKLGKVEVQAGNLAAARGHFDRFFQIAEALAAANPTSSQAQRDLSVSLIELGDVEVQAGNLAAARGHFDRSLKIDEVLAAVDPTSTKAQRDLSVSLTRLGDVEEKAGNLAAARGHFDRSLKIYEALAAVDPTSTQAQRDLSVSLEWLGDVEVQAGNLAAARGHFDRSLKAREALAAVDPTSTQAQRAISVSLMKLGDVEMQAGNLAAARGHFDRSLKGAEALAAADPNSAQAQRDLSVPLEKLGDVEVQAGNLAAARGHFDRSLKIAEALAAADPTSAQAVFDVVLLHLRFMEITLREQNPASLRTHLQTAKTLLAEMDRRGQVAGFAQREQLRTLLQNLQAELDGPLKPQR